MADPELLRLLTRTEASAAVNDLGWRYILNLLQASVPVGDLAQAAEVAAALIAAAAHEADTHLRVDLRTDRVELTLQTRASEGVTAVDTELAARLSAALDRLGRRPSGATTRESVRPVEALEICIDALDSNAIRPFWKAVLGYTDTSGEADDAILDPAGLLPTIWFQHMDQPRPDRNRIHFDISVAHDEGEARVQAALAAGGRLVSASHAPSFWVLADPEGNEICVCTWVGRDPAAG